MTDPATLRQCLDELQRSAGIPEALLQGAEALLAEPPAGSVDPEEIAQLPGQGALMTALLLAVLAATDFRRKGKLLAALLDYLIPRENHFSDYDRGRLWHIQGFAAWRLDDALLNAYTGFGRGLQLLTPLDDPDSRSYLGRVWNSLAQLMHHQGRYQEARFGFETALHYRQNAGDPIDRAFTLGNLARVCMDFGDYRAAADYLQQDLDISRDIAGTPPHVEAQLLSELGACYLQLGESMAASDHYRQSTALAARHGNPIGQVFSALGLGRVALALQPADLTEAGQQLELARKLLATATMPEGLRTELMALTQELEGDIQLSGGQPQQAIAAYQPAREHFESATTTVPREMAQLLFKLAQSHLAAGNEMEGAITLRTALGQIDATALDEQRETIESLLKERFPQLWMLHAAGRFIGQRQIDYFLDQAGKSGFLGSKQEMAVLFSDIRGFTTLSEALEPEELIRMLNDFLARMTRSIERFDGMVDKFIGDAVMAIFPADEAATSCRNAALAALMMQAELDFFNRELAARDLQLAIGIGLHYGPLISGLIGSPQKRSYTVIGDVVNSASRLEGMTKQLGAGILLSDDLASALPAGDFLLRPLGSYSPKGRAEPIGVHDLMGLRDAGLHSAQLEREISRCRGFLAQLEQQPPKAIGMLQAIGRECEDDKRAAGYGSIARLIERQLLNHPEQNPAQGIRLSEK